MLNHKKLKTYILTQQLFCFVSSILISNVLLRHQYMIWREESIFLGKRARHSWPQIYTFSDIGLKTKSLFDSEIQSSILVAMSIVV